MTAEYHTGRGSLKELPHIIKSRFGPRARALVLHGRSSFVVSGADKILADAEINWRRFSEIAPNPDLSSVQRALETYRGFQPQIIVAVGGGSVIDTAKAVLAFAFGGAAEEILEGRFTVPLNRPGLVAVPTTAGSGSEATHFAVVYHNQQKYSLADPMLQPDIVLLDADLPASCPSWLMLASGADAVCQSVESWWNRNATAQSRLLAESALELLITHFFAPDGDGMLEGSNLAGQAINITKTTGGHALAYGLTTRLGLPHGFAVLAVMQVLVRLMDRNGVTFDDQGILRQLFSRWGASFPSAFDAFCEAVWHRHPISQYFALHGCELVAELVAGVNVERLRNHPVDLTATEINDVYREVFGRHK